MNEQVTLLDDGREIRWRTDGTGSPTVVLEAGLTASAGQWSSIQPRLARTTRVVAVSRAGYGGSTSVRRRPAQGAVEDLATVLAEVEGPLVLVGHSWGGLLCRLYASAHPTRVGALVLVDATHEGIAAMRSRRWRVLAGLGMRAVSWQARLGLLRRRLEGGGGALAPVLAGMPTDARKALVDEMTSPSVWTQAARDVPAVSRLVRDLHAQPLPAPAVPVVVVLGGREHAREARTRSAVRAAYREWMTHLPDGRLVLAPRSGHLVPHEDEDLLVQVVEDLVAEVSRQVQRQPAPALDG